MSVRLIGGFESSARWRRVGGAVDAALRAARLTGWDVVLRPSGPADAGRPPSAAAGQPHGLLTAMDVADMHLDLAVPDGGHAIADADVGGLVVGLIAEAEDESADDYGPADEDDH